MEKLVSGREVTGTKDRARIEGLYNIARNRAESKMETAGLNCCLSTTIEFTDMFR